MTIERLVDPEDFPASLKMTYLNTASVALMYRRTAEATIGWQQDIALNGTLNFSEVAEVEIFDPLRTASAELFKCGPNDIAVGSSATELLSSLAWSMLTEPDKVIICTNAAHPTSIYPFQRTARHIGCDVILCDTDEMGLVDTNKLLNMIDDRTGIVVISHVEYKSGQKYNLELLAEKAHHHGAYIVVDATQSVGQIPIDVSHSDVDAIVSSGYKWLCGPFGVAIMYLSPKLQKRLDPGMVGWRSHVDLWDFRADRLEFSESARRFEAGTMAYGCAVGLAI